MVTLPKSGAPTRAENLAGLSQCLVYLGAASCLVGAISMALASPCPHTFAAAGPSAVTPHGASGIHIVMLMTKASGSRGTFVFWAGGFQPGEQVAVSWGASSRGIVWANRDGVVTGTERMSSLRARLATPQLLSLYGLSSHRALFHIFAAGTKRPHARRRNGVLPPLYLGMLPGPVLTLALPLGKQAFRTPAAAGALGIAPLLLAALVIRARARRAGRRPRGRQSKRRR